jgi:hypothetical protein
MARSGKPLSLGGVVLSGVALAIIHPPACAQGYGGSGTLGGYGAAVSGSSLGMSDRTPLVIPYGGQFGGFMPSRMGGGSTLSFRSRPDAAMGSGRTTFSLSPLSGGMSSMNAGADRYRPGARATSRFGSRGATGLGGMRRMPGPGSTSVMPPSIGYPFRQPPSVTSPSSSASGMSM